MNKKPIGVSKDELDENLFEDVLFFKFAEGGAMGEPGGVVWVRANGTSYHCNYCYGDISYEDLVRYFIPLRKCSFGMFGLGSLVPDEWKYVSLGMGNHLIIKASAYDEFKELTKDIQRASELYGRWYEAALEIAKKEKETTKMKNGITELVFILDRSGSMAGLETDTIGGFNAMIEEQTDLQSRFDRACVTHELHCHHKRNLYLVGIGGLVFVNGYHLYVSGLCHRVCDYYRGRVAVYLDHSERCHLALSDHLSLM